MKKIVWLMLLALALPVTAQAQDSLSAQGDLPPPGFGTLNQDDIAIVLRQEDLEIRFVVLDERVLRLLAPDAYASLRALLRSKESEIDSVSRRSGVTSPGILFVTFFGRRPGARFDPQNVNVVIRNQLKRPIGLVRYSANFNSQQLEVRQQATGFVLFEELLPVFEPFTISYGVSSTDAWEGKLVRLQRERARITGRTRRDTTSTN